MGDLIRRFGNTALGDTCARVGGDIPRKLALSDRLTGAFLQAYGEGIFSVYICIGAAAALVKYMRENPDCNDSRRFSQALRLARITEYCTG